MRVANLRAEPRATLLLDRWDEDWSRLWWIRLEAMGRVVRPESADRDAAFRAAEEALRAKYPQYAEWPLLRPPPTLLAFDELEIRSWCAGPS